MNPELKRIIFEWIVTSPEIRAAGGWPDDQPVPLHWMQTPRDPPMPYMVYSLKEVALVSEDGSSQVQLIIDVWDTGNRSTRCDKIAYEAKKRVNLLQAFCDSEGNPLVVRANFTGGSPIPTNSEKVWRYENNWSLFFVDTP